MSGGQWLYGVIAIVIALHVVTLLYAFHRDRKPTGTLGQPDTKSSPSVSTETATDTVACAHCGEMNAPSYRFCRGCVADLSGRAAGDATAMH
jgi:hypothetical protein